ncbi:MAG: hypothetical protein IJW75_00980, partial [Alphaproteobacteria bacterium]|nr:hypothetical protein [Alphaproteobacteria bacterium]
SDMQRKLHPFSDVLNKNGQFAGGVDKGKMMYGFDERDLQRHAAQVRTGKAQKWVPSNSEQQVRRYNNAQDMMQRGSQTPQSTTGGQTRDNTTTNSSRQRDDTREKLNQIPTHPDGKTATWENPIREVTVNPDGTRVTKAHYVDATGAIATHSDKHDEKGRIVESHYEDNKGNNHYERTKYDDTNNTSVRTYTHHASDGSVVESVDHKQYDERGKVISSTSKTKVHSIDEYGVYTQTSISKDGKTMEDTKTYTDGTSVHQSYKYDENGRVSDRTVTTTNSDGVSETLQHHNKYNDKGELVSEKITTERGWTTTYEHSVDANGSKTSDSTTRDEEGRVREYIISSDEGSYISKMNYSDDGRTTSEHRTSVSASGQREESTITKKYTEDGRLDSKTTSSGGMTSTETYDDQGRVTGIVRASGFGVSTSTIQYSEDGRSAVATHISPSGDTYTTDRVYDENGKMISETYRPKTPKK